MIQNAADAIRARRCVKGTPADFGVISIALRERENGVWLEVQDNGIGMGANVLTGALLDFGTSLWRSNTMQQEHPGLIGRGLNPTGRFGIGFLSVFMLGKHVKVTSRRHDAASVDMRTLEFQHGPSSRPVLREPTPNEQWPDCGTKVAVRLLKVPDEDGGLLPRVGKSNVIDLPSLVTSLCPTLDVSIEVTDRSGTSTPVLKADDWISLSEAQLLTRVRPNPASTQEEVCANNLQTLRSPDGHLFGRACIPARPRYRNHTHGVVTIGGLRARILNHIGGVLKGGEPETLTRDSTIPTVPLSVLSRWATEQASLLCACDATDWSRVVCTQVVFALGGDPGDLPIGLRDEKGITRKELSELLESTDTIHVFEGMEVEYDEEKDDMHSRAFNDGFTPEPSVLFLTTAHPRILTVGTRQWPMCLPDYGSLPGARTPWDAFVSLVEEVW